MEIKKLYHINVFMPENLIEQSLNQQRTVKFYIFTKHVKFKIFSKNPYFKNISFFTINKVLKSLKTSPIIPFEIETEIIDNKETVTKYAIRAECDKNHDIVLVIRTKVVITAYCNNKNDNHSTLDVSKYEKKTNV